MKILHDEAPPGPELATIEDLFQSAGKLTAAGKRRLLSKLARICLEDADWTEVPLFNNDGRPFSYVMALPKPEHAFTAEFTPAIAAEIVRAALTPENSISWQEMLAQLDAEDEREDAAETPQSAHALGPLPTSRP